MSDQAWAMIIGVAVVVVLRIVDWWFPKGRMSKWAALHSVPAKDDDEPPT